MRLARLLPRPPPPPPELPRWISQTSRSTPLRYTSHDSARDAEDEEEEVFGAFEACVWREDSSGVRAKSGLLAGDDEVAASPWPLYTNRHPAVAASREELS